MTLSVSITLVERGTGLSVVALAVPICVSPVHPDKLSNEVISSWSANTLEKAVYGNFSGSDVVMVSGDVLSPHTKG